MSIRRVAVLPGDGRIKVEEHPVPPLEPGTVRIRTGCTLVSPGTEFGGWDSLAKQLRSGASAGKSRQFGYSAAGVVEAVGDGVANYQPGDRVAAIGAGYAVHSDLIVVPHNLCTPLHDEVRDEEGSYAMLLATALHAVRRGAPAIGETWLVVGLGLVGMLTAQMLQLSGAFVLGSDEHEFRVDLARKLLEGAWLNTDPGFQSGVLGFTHDYGLDGAVLAFGGPADQAMDSTVELMKTTPDGHPEGTIVTVGWPNFSYSGRIGEMNNIDLRRASRTGPGYHDEAWEHGGPYPPVFMRWSTQTNLQLCMKLLRRGRISVEPLTTHRLKFAEIEDVMPSMLERPDEILGVVFCHTEGGAS